MDLGLNDRRVAVMAASSGLGKAAATAISREGARVAICARGEDRLERASEEIEGATGNEVVAIPADVSTREGAVGFIDGAADALGGLDGLVTNKGGPPHGGFADHDDAAWQDAFELVAMSYVRAVRAAIPHFQVAGGGSVVAIESTSVEQPIPNLVLSNAVRPVVVALSKSLALDHAGDGIRFNVVLPGSMATERIEDLTRDVAEREGIDYDAAMEARLADIPAGRLGEPIELGELIAWLVSDRASYITGEVIRCDGGVVQSVY